MPARRIAAPSKAKPSTEVVTYARVSSKEQEREGFSIPAQRRLLLAYASDRGLTVAREFVDVETAKSAGRVGFGEMIAFLKITPACRAILVEKTDRLYRNLKDWVTLDEVGVEIHFAKENVILSRESRSTEKFMHGIKVLMAKNYIDNLSEETRKGMREKSAQGIWPSYAPLGYKNVVGANGKRGIDTDPVLGPLVSRLFEWYATGEHSLRQVTRLIRAEGFAFRKSGEPISHATVHRVLRNRIYTGDFDWDGTTYKGIHTPLVSKELWGEVQDVLDRRFAGKHRKEKHSFAFSGLVTCGHCGCALVGEIKKKRYVYYHCTGYKGKCPERYTREEDLEVKFTELLRRLTFDEEVIEWVREALRESHGDEKRHHEEAVARFQAEYVHLQNRIDTMYVDKLDGRVEAEFFDRKAAEWRSEQAGVLRAIEDHQGANQNYLEEGVQLLDLARRAHLLFADQSPRQKRQLLGFLVSNCSWKGGELSATFREPFDALAITAATHESKKAAGGSSDDLSENWLLR